MTEGIGQSRVAQTYFTLDEIQRTRWSFVVLQWRIKLNLRWSVSDCRGSLKDTNFALASLTLILGRAMSSRSRWLLGRKFDAGLNDVQEENSLLNQTPELDLRHRLLVWSVHGWLYSVCATDERESHDPRKLSIALVCQRESRGKTSSQTYLNEQSDSRWATLQVKTISQIKPSKDRCRSVPDIPSPVLILSNRILRFATRQ